MNAYRGADRRGLIGRPEAIVSPSLAVAMVAATLATPFAVAATASTAGIRNAALATGAADTAFVAFVVVATLLALRWRLAGDAACVPYLAVAALVALLVVPATMRTGRLVGLLGAVRSSAVVVVLVLCAHALRSPEVRADARPARSVVAAVAAAILAAAAADATPVGRLLDWSPGGIAVAGVLEAAACGAVAAALVISGLRRQRLLPLAFAAAVAAIGLACTARATFAATATGTWSTVPSLAVLVGALGLLVVLGGDGHRLIVTVVLHDVRGRRRWEAAETELTIVRNGHQGQRHDIRSMLSAVDGGLLVLARHRDQVPAARIDRLIAATREQIALLQSLVGGESAARAYDLSALLHAIVAVRGARSAPVRCEIEPGLEVVGHPDRLAAVVHNLLTNVDAHAPQAAVTVTARESAEGIEVAVLDDGPGLSDRDLARALERGWRSGGSGSGLGLFQCRELTAAERGTLVLAHTDPLAPPGRRGLTVRIRLPARAGSPIL